MIFRACATCGAPFKPRHPRHRHCTAHELHGREATGSPSNRSQDADYYRERRRVLAGNPSCHWCGRPADTADHVVPVVRGGAHRGNLVPACERCNKSRQDNPAWTPPAV